MAGLAALRKAAAVRILVAIGTLIKRNPDILRFAIGSVRVTLRALYPCVQAGQRTTRLRVVELRHADLLPVDEVVARLALRAEAPLVLIFVAGCAGS